MKSVYAALSLCCFVEVAFAAGPPVAHQFQSGQKAVASEVNANFQELADRISAIPGATTYAYQNYIGNNVTQKVFATSGTISCGNTETRNYSRTSVAGGTQIVETHIVEDGDGACSYRTFEHLATTTSRDIVGWTTRDDTNPSTILSEVTLTSPIPGLLSVMPLGGSWGSSSDATSTPPGDPGMTEKNTLLGVENVTVPYGSFNGCLKIHTLRTSASNGLFSRMSWYCPNVGLVKQMQHALNGSALLKRELSSMTTE